MSKAISEDQRFCFSITVVIQSLSHVWLCDPLDDSMPGFPVLHHFLELAQRQVHWISDAIQSPYPLSPPSPPAFNLCQHQGLFQWVGSSHQVAKLQGLHLQHPSNEYSGLISFGTDWFALPAVQRTLKSLLQYHSSKASVLRCSAFFMVQLLYPYMATGKTTAVIIHNFVGKEMFLLFNTLSAFVIAFLSKSKCCLISWLQSPSAVILEPRKIKSVPVSTFFPSICH